MGTLTENLWQPIDTAPAEGRYLVRGGTWCGEINGADPDDPGPWLVEGFGFSVVGTDAYSAYISEPTHWAPVPMFFDPAAAKEAVNEQA